MAARVHPTAIVEAGAQLGHGTDIGAYAYVGGGAAIGDRCRLQHHATVEGNTVLGRDCEVFPYACIGLKTQDLKFKGGNPGLRIGDRNVFREYVSVHLATHDGDFTRVGDDNHILAYSHVAHDCVLGAGIVMSNGAVLAGHVVVGNHAVLGGYAGVHQFCRIGEHAMLSACAKLVQDLPPYFIADGVPATVRTINKVGLERHGYAPAQLERVKQIFRILYRDGLNRAQALEKLAAHGDAGSAEFARVLDFAKQTDRGLAPGGS